MKIGMAISATFLIALGLIVFFKMQPAPADSASGTLNDSVLSAQSLPKGLPGFGVTPGEREDDGSALLDSIEQSKNILRAGGYEDEKPVVAAEVTDQLERAARARLATGLLDKQIPNNRFESAEIKQDVEALARAVKYRIDALIEEGDFEQAPIVAASYLAFGRQMFENNLRLKARQRGLVMMKSALAEIRRIALAAVEDGALEPEEAGAINSDAQRWSEAIAAVESAWNAKLKTTESVNADAKIPNIADLARIAESDQDRTFRVWAALRLGYARFERGTPGNQEAINSALDSLEQGDDAMVVAAAKAGRAIPDRETYHELRK